MQTATRTKTGTMTPIQLAVLVGTASLAAVAAAVTLFFSRIAPTFALSASTPGGPSAPGMSEALRFTVSAPATANVVLTGMTFALNATDNASSGWTSCAKLGSSSVSLYEMGGSLVSSEKTFLNESMLPCSGGETIAYIKTSFTSPVSIRANATRPLQVWIDSTKASAADDDMLRVDIPNVPEAVHWTDPRGIAHDATGLGLPITGNTIAF